MFGPLINLIFTAMVTVGVGLWLARRVQRRDWPIAAGLLLAVALTVYFGFRLVDRSLYWANPDHYAMTPQPWMSPGMIERSWQLPPRSLAPVIGIDPGQGKGKSLDDIARQRGEPVEALIARIQAALPDAGAPAP